MKNRRYSDNDKHFWPFTWSRTGLSWRPLGIVVDSGARDGQPGGCHVRVMGFGRVLICELPPLVKDLRIRHAARWNAATIARLGRDWYEEVHPREYGFYLSSGDLYLYYGAQTMDSATSRSRCVFLPWTNWRHVRLSLYDLEGKRFATEYDTAPSSFAAREAVQAACPKARFYFKDYDGESITATTRIEESEWRFGTKWCSWLSWFRRPRIQRSLAIEFSAEVGPEKGSWKGGTLGHGIEMLEGELHEAAFRRYCELEHRSKSRRFKIKYLGTATEQAPGKDAFIEALEAALRHLLSHADDVRHQFDYCPTAVSEGRAALNTKGGEDGNGKG